MELLKGFNQVLYFLVELSMFSSLGYLGFRSDLPVWGKYLAGIGLPLLAATLWGIFAAPRSAYRLDTPYRAVFALLLFGLTALLLYRTGYPRLGITFGLTALGSQLLALVLRQ
ncbi:YrdB family protein [Spirosoma koreense]